MEEQPVLFLNSLEAAMFLTIYKTVLHSTTLGVLLALAVLGLDYETVGFGLHPGLCLVVAALQSGLWFVGLRVAAPFEA